MKRDFCGYEHRANPSESRSSCCLRPSIADDGRCVWHTDDRSAKTPDALRETAGDAALLDGATLPSVNLGDINLSGASLRGVSIPKTSLHEADLSGADLRKADAHDADLSGADLSGADLRDADLSDAYLYEANLKGADLRDATACRTTFWNADLTEADASKSTLTDADFRDADLTDAVLWKTDADAAGFRGANLTDATVWKASLVGADFRGADLTRAGFVGADLTDAVIEDAKLDDTNLDDATLVGIMPYGATFDGVSVNGKTRFKPDDDGGILSIFTSRSVRCAYDPDVYEGDGNADELLTKASETYRIFERLARDNTLPELERESFVRRQSLEREMYLKETGKGDLDWFVATLTRPVSRYVRRLRARPDADETGDDDSRD